MQVPRMRLRGAGALSWRPVLAHLAYDSEAVKRLVWWPVAIGAAVGVGIGLCSPYAYSIAMTLFPWLRQPTETTEADYPA